jgi:Ca2+-binding RTX toxin-like protein
MAYITGTDKPEIIDAADGVTNGNDIIFGLGGNDIIAGRGGDDWINGGPGADYIDGGEGRDTANYELSTSGVLVSLESGRGYGGDAEGDTLVKVENLMGTIYNDTLIGNGVTNYLWGATGNDTLKGGGGDDMLNGGPGNDILRGGDGRDLMTGAEDNDSLFGGADGDALLGEAGDDSLAGGDGFDNLWGGLGADTFVWSRTSETGVTASTPDTIHDFNFAEGDRINLSPIDANLYAAGNQAFTFIGNGAFSGAPGEVRYYHADGDTYIELQTGTSVDVEGVIRLFGIHTPEAGWFVL